MRAWGCEGKDQGLELGAGSDFPPEQFILLRPGVEEWGRGSPCGLPWAWGFLIWSHPHKDKETETKKVTLHSSEVIQLQQVNEEAYLNSRLSNLGDQTPIVGLANTLISLSEIQGLRAPAGYINHPPQQRSITMLEPSATP